MLPMCRSVFPLPDPVLSNLLMFQYALPAAQSCPLIPSCCLQDLLQRRSDMVGWHERHPQLFHRSNWGVGPRRGLMPLLQSYSNGSGGLTGAVLLGACYGKRWHEKNQAARMGAILLQLRCA